MPHYKDSYEFGEVMATPFISYSEGRDGVYRADIVTSPASSTTLHRGYDAEKALWAAHSLAAKRNIPVYKDGQRLYAADRFEFTVKTEEGATYTPWTNGRAVGFKVTAPDRATRYLYLNPSSTDDLGESNAFVYLEENPDEQCATVCYVNIWDDAVTG